MHNRLIVNGYDDQASTYAQQVRRQQTTDNTDTYGRFCHLQNEFANIPDMDEAFQILEKLLSELKNAKSPNEKAFILFNSLYAKCG